MDANNWYTLGLILGSITQPSTFIALILTLIFKKKRRPIILTIVFVICILQWYFLRGSNLGIGSLIIPILSGFLVVYIISIFKNNKNEINKEKVVEEKKEKPINNTKGRLQKIIVYPVILFIFIIGLYMITPLMDTYYNEIKPLREGYTIANGKDVELMHDNEKISSDIMRFIHYDNYIDEQADDYDVTLLDSRLNKKFLKCVDEGIIYNITCIKEINEPLLSDDNCSWTFYGHTTIAKYKNYYLVNIEEGSCGSMNASYNSYYLFNYNGKKIIVDKVIPSGRYPERPIKFYKINDWGFQFVTSGCFQAADSCRGLRANWLEFKFNE